MDIEFTDVDIYKLSTAQKKAIEEAKAQIEKGDFLTDEEANAEIEQWLKR